MLKNKVSVWIDSVLTMALVDTGATISVMSFAFKRLLGRKVLFCWDRTDTFRGVSGELLHPVGVCSVEVSLGGHVFNAEFAVLPHATHDVILGLDFLKLCGANVDCRTGEITVDSSIPSTFMEHPPCHESALCVCMDTVVPPLSAKCVPVTCSPTTDKTFDATVEPIHFSCMKKNVMIPNCTLSVVQGRTSLWTINCSDEPTILPEGLKLAAIREQQVFSLAILTESRDSPDESNFDNVHAIDSSIMAMINKALSTNQRRELASILGKHSRVFDFAQKEDPPSFPPSRIQHRIDTACNRPIRQKPYRVSPSERKVINEQVCDMLKKNVIQESCSPWAAPVILVKKKDGSWRFCVDYRRLNAITKKDVYPLPRIDDAIDCLSSASYFSSVDLRSGYWQIPMHKEDKEKTAFVTPDGLFEFNVMPFGLCNAPATFERFMDNILRGLKWEVCMCYLDDVVIFGRTFREHNTRLDLVLDCLSKARLVLNSKKCHFGERQTLVLGHLVDKEGIRPDPAKTAAVEAFNQPRSVKELRSFLGLCSYFRRFIPGFANIAHPLTCLLQKGVRFEFTPECESAFCELKFRLTSHPILRHFDPMAPTEVHSDASAVGVGAVLVQRVDSKEHVVAYASRSLSNSERNYTVTEQECLAVVFAVQRFRSYLYGRSFTVVTDHHSLCWLVNLRDPSGRLARWTLRLQEYDFTVSYKSGRRHADADCLSRLPLPTTDCDADNFDGYIASLEQGFPDKNTFRTEQQKDSTLQQLLANGRNSSATRFCLCDGLLYKKNYSATGSRYLLVVPKSLRVSILRAMHDDPTSGHLGATRTLYRLQERFYWPKMHQTTQHYVSSCDECQRRKRPTSTPPGRLHPVPPPRTPFEQVGIDLLGPFPRSSNGNRWIVVCADHLTRYCETAAIPSATARDVCLFMLRFVILRHGPPKVVISDRGRQFTADVVEEMLRLCASSFRHSTPYHPQTNGLTERTNRTLTNMLSMYVSSDHKNWDDVLPFITYAFNTAQHETTGYSPFSLLYARRPRYTLDTIFPFLDHDDLCISETICRAEEARRLAHLRTLASQERSKLRFDRRRRHVIYEHGDLVWLWTPVRKRGLCEKLLAHYVGPYVVIDRISEVTYRVARLHANGRRAAKTELTHIARLKPFIPRETV
uniref:RNA-directed DNA polymerase n=1 Tax=Rhipicephalus pulchellus TaxID=72859 RepID=L7LVQ9_RHIPC